MELSMRCASLPWYALRVRSKREGITSDHLAAIGREVFSPTYCGVKQWSDRKKQVQSPLFPGYVFCRFDVQQRLPILTSPGLIAIVGVGKVPMSVPDTEVEAIRTILRSGVFAQPWPFLTVGQKVEICGGPLSGVDGILVNFKDSYRVVVSINMLQRSIAAEVEGQWLRPVRPNNVVWANNSQPELLRHL